MSAKLPPEDGYQLLLTWFDRTRASQHAHYDASKRKRRQHTAIGLLIMLLSVGTGAAALVLLNQTVGPEFYYALSGASAFAGVLAVLQTLLRTDERAEEHRRAGARYGALRREIEQALAVYDNSSSPATAQIGAGIIDRIRKGMDEAASSAPNLKFYSETDARSADMAAKDKSRV